MVRRGKFEVLISLTDGWPTALHNRDMTPLFYPRTTVIRRFTSSNSLSAQARFIIYLAPRPLIPRLTPSVAAETKSDAKGRVGVLGLSSLIGVGAQLRKWPKSLQSRFGIILFAIPLVISYLQSRLYYRQRLLIS